MGKMSISEIASILGIKNIEADIDITILLTDSRSLSFPRQSLFFALVTSKGDGHLYIDELLQKGVRAFVISKAIKASWQMHYSDAVFIRVDDTAEALCKVASEKRKKLNIPVIAVTGSNGKTTFKELLYQLLSPYRKVGRSPKSYNSSIGVPLSIWGIEPDDSLAIIEAGISQPGEMKRLESVIRPDWGVFTHLGEAHQENFESLSEKAREKLTLFSGCKKLFAPYDDTLLRTEIARAGLNDRTIYWSKENQKADLYVSSVDYYSDDAHISLTLKGSRMEINLPFLDEGSIQCSYLALLVMSEIMPSKAYDPDIYASLTPISMRLEVVEGQRGALLINDTYSSDYDSLKMALDFMKRRNTDHQPTALILSDMKESSKDPNSLYTRVAELVNLYRPDKLILVGEELKGYLGLFDAPKIMTSDHTDELTETMLLNELEGHIVLLKGARVAKFEKIVERMRRQTHQTILNVNLTRLAHNLNQLRSFLPPTTKTICMIKADGYGLGAFEVAKTLQRNNVDYLAVAVVDEGIELRERGIHTPIIVMNPEVSTFHQLIKFELQPEIYSLSLLRQFVAKSKELKCNAIPIHLKFDTGMHRLGMDEGDISELLDILHNEKSVKVASIFTHLAAADDPSEDEYTRKQMNALDQIFTCLERGLGYSIMKHALNTAGILRFSDYFSDPVRIGIGLYGVSPILNRDFGLEPVAELRTIILQIREIGAGETVGYGRKGHVNRPSRIGVIPIGYADGLSRLLGNGRAHFRVADGTLVPTIGNICMDISMIDLTDAPSVEEGSSVVLFGPDLPLENIAQAGDTIPYEILARLSNRIVRRYFSEF